MWTNICFEQIAPHITKNDGSLMGAGGTYFNFSATSKNEMAWLYFLATRLANDVANKRRDGSDYPELQNIKVTKKSGKMRYDGKSDTTGKEEIDDLD